MVGGKRKTQDGGASPPTPRKPKVTGQELDKECDVDNAIVVATGTEESPQKPQVNGYVQVEKDPEVDPGIAGKNPREHSFGTLADNIILPNNEVELEVAGSNKEMGTSLMISNVEVTVQSQVLRNVQEQLDQASTIPKSILARRDTRSPQGKTATNGSPCALAENSELNQLKEEVTQNEIEMLRKEVTLLREEKKELIWLKNTYLKCSCWDSELHLAAYSGTEEEVKKLLQDGAYVNSRNKKLKTPMSYAALRDDKAVGLRIIKYLIENGADPYARDNEDCTFLHNLVLESPSLTPNQFHDIATYLVSKNLAKLFNTPGWSCKQFPLQGALHNLEVEGKTLKALNESGVDLKMIDEHGDNLLCYVLEGNRSTELMSDLILLGVDWRHLNKDERSLLHLASELGHVSGVKYLLTLGLNVNAVNALGNTPLHLVVLFGKGDALGTAKVLIENGASVEIKNSDGRTPLDEALHPNDMPDKDAVIQLLKDSA